MAALNAQQLRSIETDRGMAALDDMIAALDAKLDSRVLRLTKLQNFWPYIRV